MFLFAITIVDLTTQNALYLDGTNDYVQTYLWWCFYFNLSENIALSLAIFGSITTLQ